MFDQLKQMKELAGMLGNAGEIKAKAEQMRENLQHKVIQGQAGGGAVTVTMNGKFEVTDIKLDPAVVQALVSAGDPQEHKKMVEDLIAEAMNHAVVSVQQVVQKEMAQLTGGMNLPGLEGLLG